MQRSGTHTPCSYGGPASLLLELTAPGLGSVWEAHRSNHDLSSRSRLPPTTPSDPDTVLNSRHKGFSHKNTRESIHSHRPMGWGLRLLPPAHPASQQPRQTSWNPVPHPTPPFFFFCPLLKQQRKEWGTRDDSQGHVPGVRRACYSGRAGHRGHTCEVEWSGGNYWGSIASSGHNGCMRAGQSGAEASQLPTRGPGTFTIRGAGRCPEGCCRRCLAS